MDQRKPPTCCMTFKSVVKFLSFCLLFVWPSLPLAIEGSADCSWKMDFTITYPNGTFMGCRKCPKCAVGHGLPFDCGKKVPVDDSTDCRPCETTKYSNTIDSSTCKQCDDCRPGFKVMRECNRTQNRQCDLSCQSNYYLDNSVDPPECKLSPTASTTTTRPVITTHVPVNTTEVKNHSSPLVVNSSTPSVEPATSTTNTVKESGGGNSSQSPESIAIIVAVTVSIVVFLVLIALVLRGYLIYRYNSNDISDEDLEIPVGKQGRPLSTISFDVEEKLTKKLDVIHNGEKGWRKLGIYFKIDPDDLDYMDLSYNRRGESPTNDLLEKLKTLGTTVDELINALKDPGVNRRDVAWLVIQDFETERNSESSSVV